MSVAIRHLGQLTISLIRRLSLVRSQYRPFSKNPVHYWYLSGRKAALTPAQQFEKTLRRQIQDNHGFGWNVIAQSGKTKLTGAHADGAKSAKVLY